MGGGGATDWGKTVSKGALQKMSSYIYAGRSASCRSWMLLLLLATTTGSELFFGSVATRWEFATAHELDGWDKQSSDASRVDESWSPPGIVRLRETGFPARDAASGMWLDSPAFAIPASGVTQVYMRARFLSSCHGTPAWVFQTAPSPHPHSFLVDVNSTMSTFSGVFDGLWHEYTVPVPPAVLASGLVTQLRFLPCYGPSGGADIEIDWIRVAHRPSLRRVEGCARLEGPGTGGTVIPYLPYSRSGSTTMHFSSLVSIQDGSNASWAPPPLGHNASNSSAAAASQGLAASQGFATTYNCAPRGGDVITLTGEHFGIVAPPLVFVNERPCLGVTVQQAETQLTCRVPEAGPSPHSAATPMLVRIANGEMPLLWDAQFMLEYRSPVAASLPDAPAVANVAARSVDVLWLPVTDPWAAATVTGYAVQWRAAVEDWLPPGVALNSSDGSYGYVLSSRLNLSATGRPTADTSGGGPLSRVVTWGAWGVGSEGGGLLLTVNVTTTRVSRLTPARRYQFRVFPLSGDPEAAAAATRGACSPLVDRFGRVGRTWGEGAGVSDATRGQQKQQQLRLCDGVSGGGARAAGDAWGADRATAEFDDADEDDDGWGGGGWGDPEAADDDAGIAGRLLPICAGLIVSPCPAAAFSESGSSDPAPPAPLNGPPSAPSADVSTLQADVLFPRFDAAALLDYGPTITASAPNAEHWTGGEGRYGLVLVEAASVSNCNASFSCSDAFGGGDPFSAYVRGQEAAFPDQSAPLEARDGVAQEGGSPGDTAEGMEALLKRLLDTVDAECAAAAAVGSQQPQMMTGVPAPGGQDLLQGSSHGGAGTPWGAPTTSSSSSILLRVIAATQAGSGGGGEQEAWVSFLRRVAAPQLVSPRAFLWGGYDDSAGLAFVPEARLAQRWNDTLRLLLAEALRNATFDALGRAWVTLQTPQGTNYSQPAPTPRPLPHMFRDTSGRRLVGVRSPPASFPASSPSPASSWVCGGAPADAVQSFSSQPPYAGGSRARSMETWRQVPLRPAAGGGDRPWDSSDDAYFETEEEEGQHSGSGEAGGRGGSTGEKRQGGGGLPFRSVLPSDSDYLRLQQSGSAAGGAPPATDWRVAGRVLADLELPLGSLQNSWVQSASSSGDGSNSSTGWGEEPAPRPGVTAFPNGLAVAPARSAGTLLGAKGAATAPCGPALRLTPSLPSQTGAAWYGRALSVARGFEAVFVFRIANPSPHCRFHDGVATHCHSRGGSGLAFVLQNWHPAALGQGGRHLGYGGIPLSIAVTIDTWADDVGGEAGDNSIRVVVWDGEGGAHVSLGAAPFSGVPDLGGGAHTLRVAYDPALVSPEVTQHPAFVGDGEGTVSSLLRGGRRGAGHLGFLSVFIDAGSEPVLIVPVNLGDALALGDTQGKAWAGFTAATGPQQWQTHDILAWQFIGEA